jgi:phosphoribosyl 1,2-cyclic phosphodiesterase
MKIQFLGTGAADWPLERNGNEKEFRRLSSALVDGCLLIDFGSNVLDALKECGVGLSDIKYAVNTHRHSDHYNESALATLTENGTEFIDFKANEQKQIGKYTVLALAANHPTCEGTVHFIITDKEKTLFYGLDGAWLLMPEVDAVKKYKPDLAVLDATVGDKVGDYRIFEHNNLRMVVEMKQSLEQFVGSFYISHMARTLHTDHETLKNRMKEFGIEVAFDGLTVEI